MKKIIVSVLCTAFIVFASFANDDSLGVAVASGSTMGEAHGRAVGRLPSGVVPIQVIYETVGSAISTTRIGSNPSTPSGSFICRIIFKR